MWRSLWRLSWTRTSCESKLFWMSAAWCWRFRVAWNDLRSWLTWSGLLASCATSSAPIQCSLYNNNNNKALNHRKPRQNEIYEIFGDKSRCYGGSSKCVCDSSGILRHKLWFSMESLNLFLRRYDLSFSVLGMKWRKHKRAASSPVPFHARLPKRDEWRHKYDNIMSK